MCMSISMNESYLQSSLPDAVRKKPKDECGPKELTTSSREEDKSTTLNTWVGPRKGTKVSIYNSRSPLQFPRLFLLCFKISRHFNSMTL